MADRLQPNIAGSLPYVVARIERLPIAGWHVRAALLLGLATLFDAYDALSIAYIMPSIIAEWQLTLFDAAALISLGYGGQAIGALLFGDIAERYGRIKALTGCIFLIGIMSLLAAYATNYEQLMAARFFQGIGLGGEVPIAATYLNEVIRSEKRGKVFLLYQSTFGLGMACAAIAGALLVQDHGWQSMFLIGAIPILLAIAIPLALPESPRWLAGRGKTVEADLALQRIEESVRRSTGTALAAVAPRTITIPTDRAGRWRELFGDQYRRRTAGICLLWITAYACTYSLAAWLPTLLTKFYGLPVRLALQYSIMTSIAGAFGCIALAIVVDRIERHSVFAICFGATAIATGLLAALNGGSPALFLAMISIASFFLLIATGALYLYTPELFPTRVRAMGTGFASFSLRVTSIVTPFAVGTLVSAERIDAFFWCLFGLAAAGLVSTRLSLSQTAGKILEDVSP